MSQCRAFAASPAHLLQLACQDDGLALGSSNVGRHFGLHLHAGAHAAAALGAVLDRQLLHGLLGHRLATRPDGLVRLLQHLSAKPATRHGSTSC
jgi:hypothetical protein